MKKHELVNGTLVTESGGIVANCTCGWSSRPYFSSMAASDAFNGHRMTVDETSETSVRNCGNCACGQILKHPTLINKEQMVCRRNPPFIVQQAAQVGLSHSPTGADWVCFDGWRPIGTLPGENHVTKEMLGPLAPALERALKMLMNDQYGKFDSGGTA